MPRQHRTYNNIDDAINNGLVMTEYHKHENNPNYTVHMRQADGKVMAFTNVGADHLQTLLPKGGVREKHLKDSWVNPSLEAEVGEKGKSTTGGATSGSTARRETMGPSFDECVQQGGKVTDYHRNARGNYSIHIETRDGYRHAFTSVTGEHLKGVPGFSEE